MIGHDLFFWLHTVYSYCFLIGRQAENYSKRRASEPVNPIYDFPFSYLRNAQVWPNICQLFLGFVYRFVTNNHLCLFLFFFFTINNVKKAAENDTTRPKSLDSMWVLIIEYISVHWCWLAVWIDKYISEFSVQNKKHSSSLARFYSSDTSTPWFFVCLFEHLSLADMKRWTSEDPK